MNIIYIASTCSREKYFEYVEKKGERAAQQAQKYNLLLAEGLAANNAQVDLFSTRPINRNLEKRIWFKGEKERKNGVNFHYMPFINLPVLRNVFLFFDVFNKVLFSKRSKKDTAIVCDALNITAAFAGCLAGRIRGFKSIAIVTDIPCFLTKSSHFFSAVNLKIMQSFDGYLLLTKAMSDIVNPHNNPYIVLEGHADGKMAYMKNELSQKYDKKVCLYAGSLMEKYGIKYFINGFLKANIPNTEFHIYGNGNFEEQIREMAKEHENIKYMGIAPNSEVVEAELKAALLINPRPSNEEYTKYSFPSKNMEYMASGTPVLTTHLPGMPDDHKPYVFFIEEENEDGAKAALEKVFALSDKELNDFGKKAKEFILEKKNNVAQGKKVLDLCRQLTEKNGGAK